MILDLSSPRAITPRSVPRGTLVGWVRRPTFALTNTSNPIISVVPVDLAEDLPGRATSGLDAGNRCAVCWHRRGSDRHGRRCLDDADARAVLRGIPAGRGI